MERVTTFARKPIFWIILIVIILFSGIGIAGFYQYRKVTSELSKIKDTPGGNGQLTDERQRELIAEVSAKIMLPADEKPTVAVVSDINRLKDQQFFSAGQNGDVVLIYMNSRRAILYRPVEKKIIEVAPVNLSNNGASASADVAGTSTLNPDAPIANVSPVVSPTTAPAPLTGSFALRNGTTITGLARSFETQLTTNVPQANVIERGNAAKRDYAVTTIVDVKGTKAQELSQIAQLLGIQSGSLPAGEPAPASDFLIIIGSDKR